MANFTTAFNRLANQVDGLNLKSEEFISHVRLITIPLNGLMTKGRGSNNGQTTLFYQGGYMANFAKKDGQATSWPFMWYSGKLKVSKPIGISKIDTPQGVRLKFDSTVESEFEYYHEEEGDFIPFNLNIQFAPDTLWDLLRHKDGRELLSSPAGMQGAWYEMQAEMLKRGKTQVQLLWIPSPESASVMEVAPYHGSSHKVCNWTMAPTEVGAIAWASTGDATYIEGLGLATQVLDVSAWERTPEQKKEVVSVKDILPQDKKVRQIFNKKFGRWLKENDFLKRYAEEEVKLQFMGTFDGPIAKWIKEEGNQAKGLDWLEAWKPTTERKQRGTGSMNGSFTPKAEAKAEVQKETAAAAVPSAPPSNETKVEAEVEAKAETVESDEFEEAPTKSRRTRRGGGIGSMSRASGVSTMLAEDID